MADLPKGDVLLLYLTTGEHVLSKIVYEKDIDVWKLMNPVRIVMRPPRLGQENAGMNIGFAPWQEFSKDKEFLLHPRNIISISNPLEDFVTNYNKMFSPILTPEKPQIILPS